MKSYNKITKKILIATMLISVAVIWRIVNHNYALIPNLEIVTAVSVLAALIIGFRGAIAVPIVTMIVSDLFIGNSAIYVFTWGSFALIGLSAILLRRLNNKPKAQIIGSIGFAVFSSFLFFAVTNFGVWLQGWYPATLTGLATCFTMAIPFYRTMLIGNMIIVPATVAAWQLAKAYQITKSSKIVELNNI